MQNDILSLQETAENTWQAKYLGNYGTYNIKIKINKGKIETYSCSCPSDYSPCKHIGMIKNVIDNRIVKNKENPKEAAISIEGLLQNVPHKELVNFIVSHAKYNPEFTNKLLLEFLHKATGKQENNYRQALRNSLKDIDFDYDDLYDYDGNSIEIDVLDEWFTKARDYIFQKRFDEAIAICKACIEEYADWMEDVEDEIIECIDPVYMEKPFELLTEIASNPSINSNELFQYCMAEIGKPKYERPDMDDSFNDLLAELAHTETEFNEFIALQDRLLQNVKDKSSSVAQGIIERKIAFYRKNKQPETAWQLISENLQIKSFRKQVVQQKIADGKFSEAKKLIADYHATSQNDTNYYHREWDALALSIAQKENDIPVIRKIAFAFIENYFEKEHYRIYKSSFKPGEWEKEVQKIIAHYENNGKNFSSSVADVLAEEHDATG
ncbi:MAG: SWIM zinc finger family protein, partial [Bacteroidota bacterium]|nr:SWIM zinc finger family protein [Bacteroidota bacterium]